MGKIQRRYNLWAAACVRSVSPDAARARDLVRQPRHAPRHAPQAGVPEGLGDAGVLSLPNVAREAGVGPASVQVALSRLAGAGLADVSPARGVVSDVLIKPGPLSAAEERLLSGVLDARRRAARSHLDAIGRYANLTTCRREHLLSHFGDSSARGAAPCGGCDVCDSRRGLNARPSLGRRVLAALGVGFGTTRS